MAPGDAALAERVLAGDIDLIRTLVETSMSRISAVHRGLGYDMRDLRQEAVGELLEAAGAYQPERDGNFVRLVAQRIRRRVGAMVKLERRRLARLERLNVLDESWHPAIGMETRFDGEVSNPRLARELGRLSPRLRAAIARTYWQDLNVEQAARRDGVNPEAVRRARRRAEMELSRRLGGRRLPRRVLR